MSKAVTKDELVAAAGRSPMQKTITGKEGTLETPGIPSIAEDRERLSPF